MDANRYIIVKADAFHAVEGDASYDIASIAAGHHSASRYEPLMSSLLHVTDDGAGISAMTDAWQGDSCRRSSVVSFIKYRFS